MKEPFDDQWEEQLRQAVCEAGDLLDAGFPVEDPHPHDFSHDFEQSMDHLLHRRRHRPAFRQVGRVACAVLLLLVGSMSFLSTNAQARESFFGWSREEIDGSTSYRFQDGFSEALYHYHLLEVPSEYHEVDRYISDTLGDEVYENDAGEYLHFSYQYVTKNSECTLSLFFTDEVEQKTVFIHGVPADYYFDRTGIHSNSLVWIDPESNALLHLSAFLEENEIIQMAEQVVREKK